LREEIVETVREALTVTGLPPQLLELEVTESSLVEEAENAAKILRQLKALGVSIAIDDFGTGYSSLSYLTRFPLDRLKIDRSFVHRMVEEEQNRQVVQAIVSLGHALDLKVLAEGVEKEAQRQLLAADGCDEGQGYLVSRPVPGEKLLELLS